MTRALRFLLRNWPLKLAAIVLATVLYAGVVLSENTRSWPGQVAISVVDPPPGGVLLTPPGSVSEIRYRAPLDVAGQLSSGSFRATLDLSGLAPQAGGPTVDVPVMLVSTDSRVQIVDFEPRTVGVQLDSIVARVVPVTVERGVAPEGLALGPPQVAPASVVLRGASSRLALVRSVVARLDVDASGLNIDQQVELDVADEAGDLVPGVEVTPSSVRVRIDVARELAYAVVPVVVDVSGPPAPGFRVASVEADPVTVTVSGEAPTVERLTSVSTGPVPLDGAESDIITEVSLILPSEVSLIGDPVATVTVTVVPIRGSRVLEAGLLISGARRDRTTTLSTGSVNATISGEVAALDALESGSLGLVVGLVDVAGLGIGRHEVPVAVRVPDGLTVVDVAPGTIVVRIAAAPATVVPGPSTVPTAAPGAVSPPTRPTPAASVPPSRGPVATRTPDSSSPPGGS